SGKDCISRDAGTRHAFGNTARQRELRRFGNAVMHHLCRDLYTRLARDKDDPTPSHVDVEDLQPRLIGDIGKGDRREDADIVDEDADTTGFTTEPHDTVRRFEISGDANGPVTCRVLERADRFCDAVRTAAVNNDLGAFLRQPFRNRVADTSRRTGDEGTL